MEEIDPAIVDLTNVPNPHQQTIRYAPLDAEGVLRRVDRDWEAAKKVLPRAVKAAVVTHLNETGGVLTGDMALKDFAGKFDRVYLSDRAFELYRSIDRNLQAFLSEA